MQISNEFINIGVEGCDTTLAWVEYIHTHTLIVVSLNIPKTFHTLVGNIVIVLAFQRTHVVIDTQPN